MLSMITIQEEAWDVTGVGKGRLSALKHKWEKCQAEAEALATQYHKLLSARHVSTCVLAQQ